jgi:hypothetical protein
MELDMLSVFKKLTVNPMVLTSCLGIFYFSHMGAVVAQVNMPEAEGEMSLALSLPGGACEDWLSGKGWMPGKVMIGSKRVFFGVGSQAVNAPPGHPNYITARQNAYDMAELKGKADLAKSIAAEIKQDTKAAVIEGKFSKGPKPTPQVDSRGENEKLVGSSWNKALKLLNVELDQALKKRGVTKEKKLTQAAIAKEIDKVLSETNFSKIVEVASKAQLKGIRRFYVNENAAKGKQAVICVVILQSAKNERIADAVLSGNASLAPKGKPGKPIMQALPNKKTNAGLKLLMTSYGIETRRDENGGFWLISYAQHGARGKRPNQLASANGFAVSRAMGQLRAYIGEQMAVKTKTENSETAKELENNLNSYNFNNAKREEFQSKSAMAKITGISTLMKWAALHPITKQPIGGAVVGWNATNMADMQDIGRSQAERKRPNARGNQQPAASNQNRFKSPKLNSQGGFSGSASGGTSAADF